MYDGSYSSRNQKIPIDREPISRKVEEKIEKRSKRQWVVDALQFLICLTLIVAVVLMYTRVTDVESERGVYNMDITTQNTSLTHAGASGLLSSVCVSAIIREDSNSNITTADQFFDHYKSMGTGVIIQLDKNNGSAYILTNYHVVANSTDYSGNYKNGFGYYYILPWDSDEVVQAEYVGGSSVYDIAVLKVTNSKVLKNSACTQADVEVSDNIALGEPCVAVGNSLGGNLRVTTGVVAIEEVVFYSKADENRIVTYINHTADTNSGNSGGGLFNENGKLIGIVNAKFNNVTPSGLVNNGEIVQGVNYAIPSSMALAVAQNIIRNGGTLKRPEIGLQLIKTYQWENPTIQVDGETGKLRTNYTSYMRVSSSGLYSGDILTTISYTFEGQTIVAPITHINTIESHLYNLSQGDVVTLKVVRNNITRTVKLTVSTQTDIA